MSSQVPVAIVGGGPVGLLASIMLSREGIEHVVLERHSGTSIHPKAVGLNQRSAEVFRECGLEAEIAAAAAPPELVGRTSWYTSLTGPTPLHGRQIAIRDAWGGGAYAEEYRAVSPANYTVLPQIRLEPILRRAAERSSLADVRFGTEVRKVGNAEHGVMLELSDPSGRGSSLTAQYVISADGGRTVGPQLGVTEHGPRDLLDMVSVHFSADLNGLIGDPGSLITWFINPDFGGSIGSGYLYHIGPWQHGRSQEWVFACAFTAQDPERFDEEAMIARIARSFGTDSLDLTVHSISHWYIQSVVADRFRIGDVFLAGDAAHRIPPWGALGLNTGIGDVHNLTWKLAHAIRHPELAGLLDSYELERKPIARAVAERSLSNFQAHGGIVDRALGIDPARPAAAGWDAIADLWQPGESGERRRAALDEAMRVLDEEFHAHGTECGYSYAAGALKPEARGSEGSFGSLVYTPESAPGHHLPHAWLLDADGEKRISTFDLLEPGRWALLVDGTDDVGGEGVAGWSEAVAGLPAPLAGLIDLRVIGGEGHAEPEDSRWEQWRGVRPGGALLVRPDRIVAWRSADASGAECLTAAVAEILGARPAE